MSGHLFVYGSLKDPAVYQAVTGVSQKRKTPAVLHGYTNSGLLEGYPVIYPQDGESVQGEVIFHICDNEWQRLDEYEGSNYERAKAIAQSASGDVACYVYRGIGNKNHSD